MIKNTQHIKKDIDHASVFSHLLLYKLIIFCYFFYVCSAYLY
jgi:hypothetical protein